MPNSRLRQLLLFLSVFYSTHFQVHSSFPITLLHLHNIIHSSNTPRPYPHPNIILSLEIQPQTKCLLNSPIRGLQHHLFRLFGLRRSDLHAQPLQLLLVTSLAIDQVGFPYSALINLFEQLAHAFDGGDEGCFGGYVDDFLVAGVGVGGRDWWMQEWTLLDACIWSYRY